MKSSVKKKLQNKKRLASACLKNNILNKPEVSSHTSVESGQLDKAKLQIKKRLNSACLKNNIFDKLGVSSDISSDNLAPQGTRETTDYPNTTLVNPDISQVGQDFGGNLRQSTLNKELEGKGNCPETSRLADQEKV